MTVEHKTAEGATEATLKNQYTRNIKGGAHDVKRAHFVICKYPKQAEQ